MELYLALAIELLWGVAYALWLQTTRLGTYLAREETWITVVIGVAVTVLIGRIVFDWYTVGLIELLFVGAGSPVIARSLFNNQRRFADRWTEVRRIGKDDEP
jgi:hypothetical protein